MMTMTTKARSMCDAGRLARPAPRIRPLDLIAEDQRRAREICEDLAVIVGSGTLDRDLARPALRFLQQDLPRHLRDMTEDLFPMVRRRCPPGDGLARPLAGIGTDLDLARACLPDLCAILATCLETGRAPTAPETATLAHGTRRLRRYLMAEKAILLPLARSLLTARDLQSLCLRLHQRRGSDPHE